MAGEVLQEVIDIKTNVQDSLNQIDKLNKGLEGVNTQLVDILKHFDELNKKSLGGINTNINTKNNYNLGTAAKFIKNSSGSVMASSTGRDELFKDYEQAIIDETRELALDTAERKRLRQQRANAESQRATNDYIRASRLEDRNSVSFIADRAKIAEAKLLNAKANQVGAQLRNPRYQFGNAFQRIGNKVETTGVGSDKIEGKILGSILNTLGATLKSPMAGAATAVASLANGLIDLGKAATTAFAEIESIKTQLGVVFSNQTQADSVFSEISQYAIKSPFGIQQTSELAVLLKQSGVYASDLMDTLKMLGDTAGGNMEKMKRIANNYAQIVSIGKASMLDMRQFAYAGIPIFEAVSKELGVSQQELRKLISDGKVTSDIIEKVFKDLTGINGIFNEATSKGAKTLKARLQNLSDAKQLALSSMGERFVKVGDDYGDRSYIEGFVTKLEDFFTWVREHNDIKNIERDVNKIATTDTRIKELESLLQYAVNIGDKDLQRQLREEIEYQKSRIDIDYQRNTNAQSYDVKTAAYERYKSQYGNLSQEDIQQKIWEYNVASINAVQDFPSTFLEMQDMYGRIIEDLNKFSKAIEDAQKVTEAEIKANRERNLINAQQLEFDRAAKAAGKEGSYTSAFEKLFSLYTSSDEYKKEQQQKEYELLKEAQDVLKELSRYLDKEGNLDITKLTYKQFTDLYNIKGALDPTKKLSIVEGKSEQQMSEDRVVLLAQWKSMSKNIADELGNMGLKYTKGRLEDITNSLSLTGNNATFFANFDIILEKQLNYLKELAENSSVEKQKIYYEMYNNLLASTSSYSLNDKGLLANPEDLLKGLSQEFIPLWKRIIAQATGLSAEGITKARTALEDYRNDMAVRSLTSNVMQAIMQNGAGAASAMSLARAGNQVAVLKGTTSEIVQIDWKSTRDAVKDFALQLSASTDVITAYKNSLEEELKTYQSLLAAGYTTAESQDIKNQKYVSEKTYKRLMETAGSQLVNAFGEDLITRGGQEVWLGDNGKFYDSREGRDKQDAAHEVAVDELVVTEDMFNVIKKILPQMEKELHEANAAQLKNKVVEDMLKDVKALYLQRIADSSGIYTSNRNTEFLWNNPEYLTSLFDSALEASRASFMDEAGNYYDAYKFLEGMSDNDLLLNAMKGDEYEHAYELSVIIRKALQMVSNDTEDLLGKGMYKGLSEEQKRKTVEGAVKNRKKQYRDFDSDQQYSPTAWLDEGGYSLGSKFIKDFFDVEKGYTVKDLYKSYAEEMGIMVEEMSALDKATVRWQESLQDVEDVMKELSESVVSLAGDLAKKAWLTPFENLGEYKMKEWTNALEEGEELTEMNAKAMKELGAEALKALGPIIAKAGFELVARGAMNGSFGLVAAGLALAAAGGFATGIGNAITDAENESKDDKEAEKLQALKDQLAELLEQARRDALYYENNLRHKTALGINKDFSMKSVNDAIITPQGDIVTTDPKDYLIATKTPNQLVGGGNVTVSPVINCNVVNNTNAKVTQQQQQNADGSIDIITIIEDVAGQYIASSKSDDAFNSREYRLRGRQSVMN